MNSACAKEKRFDERDAYVCVCAIVLFELILYKRKRKSDYLYELVVENFLFVYLLIF